MQIGDKPCPFDKGAMRKVWISGHLASVQEYQCDKCGVILCYRV